MLQTVLFEPSSGRCREGGAELLEAWRADGGSILWLNSHQEAPDTERSLFEQWFGLHPLGVQDAQRDRHPPKLEGFEGHTFVLLKGLDATSTTIEFGTIQIALFVGERFLVTRHTGVSRSVAVLAERVRANPDVLGQGPDMAAMTLCRIMIDRYMPILMGVEARIDQLEDNMMSNPRDEQLRELVTIQSNLKKLRRIMTYHVQVFATIRNGGMPGIRETVRHELNDVYEHLDRASSLADLYYELSSDLMNGYLSLASHRLNHVMKILTIVTALFVPLGFLAGVYGMNFDYMPELKWRYAYFTLLGVMAMTACTLLWFFWRRGWLRPS